MKPCEELGQRDEREANKGGIVAGRLGVCLWGLSKTVWNAPQRLGVLATGSGTRRAPAVLPVPLGSLSEPLWSRESLRQRREEGGRRSAWGEAISQHLSVPEDQGDMGGACQSCLHCKVIVLCCSEDFTRLGLAYSNYSINAKFHEPALCSPKVEVGPP